VLIYFDISCGSVEIPPGRGWWWGEGVESSLWVVVLTLFVCAAV